MFYAGSETPAPPALKDGIFRFPGTVGFDGQFYLYIAHDPLNQYATAGFIDNPPIRWRRILLPGLAWLFSAGHPSVIPLAYMGVMWTVTFLGALLLSKLCHTWGYPSWFGLAFLAIPAVAVSLDRMLTDIGLVVALLAWLWAIQERRGAIAIAAMALAPLARETGIVLAAAWFVWLALQRDMRRAMWAPMALVPFLGWAIWVHAHFGGDATPWWGWPFEGILTRLAHYAVYSAPSLGLKLALLLDYLGALGIAAAFVLALGLCLREDRSMLVFAAALYTLGICMFAKQDMWTEAYSYTRTGGPVAVMLALYGLQQRRWWLTAPLLLALPRIGFQFVWSILDSVRGLGT